MPPLENPRHEKFAKGIALGKPQRIAYRDAGYKMQDSNASRLISYDKVNQRIKELQLIDAGKFPTDKEAIRQMFMQNYSLAVEAGNIAAANVAADKLARLDGHMIERKEIGGPGDFAALSDAELIELIAEPLTGAYGLQDGEGDEG